MTQPEFSRRSSAFVKEVQFKPILTQTPEARTTKVLTNSLKRVSAGWKSAVFTLSHNVITNVFPDFQVPMTLWGRYILIRFVLESFRAEKTLGIIRKLS